MEKNMKKSNTKTKEGKIIPFVNKCDVLIVEDEPSFVVLIGSMIRSRFPNLRIRSAEDGIEGLKKVKALKPRIVWTGVKMPRMDGLEMIELIRGDPDLKNTKIIVCTGCHTMKDVKSRVLALRVDRFFPKPFDVEEALSAIAACLS
jgi:putative two-component system response regulator